MKILFLLFYAKWLDIPFHGCPNKTYTSTCWDKSICLYDIEGTRCDGEPDCHDESDEFIAQNMHVLPIGPGVSQPGNQ